MLLVQDVGQSYILNLVINMAKNKEHFYIGKGINDPHPYLYYGEKPPIIFNGKITGIIQGCVFIGSFQENPIADSIEDNEIIKVYIRKQTIKNKKNE